MALATKQKGLQCLNGYIKNNSIVFLQETHSSLETETEWKKDVRNFNLYFSPGTTSSRGVCTLILKQLDCTILDKVTEEKG